MLEMVPFIYINFVLDNMWLPGEWVVGSAGIGFTPHVITIAAGEVCDV
jgi:hypothetical protein